MKVDCQAGIGLMGSKRGGGPAVAAAFHGALEDSIRTHFPGNHAINCMAHSTENIYRRAARRHARPAACGLDLHAPKCLTLAVESGDCFEPAQLIRKASPAVSSDTVARGPNAWLQVEGHSGCTGVGRLLPPGPRQQHAAHLGLRLPQPLPVAARAARLGHVSQVRLVLHVTASSQRPEVPTHC